LRGGTWADGAGAGVFELDLGGAPSLASYAVGFRCAKAL